MSLTMNEKRQYTPEFVPAPEVLNNYAEVILASLRRTDASGTVLEGVQPGDRIIVSFPEEANALAVLLLQKITERGGIYIPRQDSLTVELALAAGLPADVLSTYAQAIVAALAATSDHFIDVAAVRRYDQVASDLVDRFDKDGRAMRKAYIAAISSPTQPMQSRVKVYYPTQDLALQNETTLAALWRDVSDGLSLEDDALARLLESDTAVKDNTERLNRLKIKKLRIVSESGDVDVSLSLADQSQWLGASGANRPSFESFTAVHRDTVNGKVTFDVPVKFGSQSFTQLTVFYEDGRAVKVLGPDGTEEHDECNRFRALCEQYPNFDRLGEFALTPQALAKMSRGYGVILWTENLPGFHVAHGSAYVANYAGDRSKDLSTEEKNRLGYNTCQAHFDLVRMGHVTVTATLEDGQAIDIFVNSDFTEQFYAQTNQS